MKTIKDNFPEIFTLLAWITLLGFITYCTMTLNKTDSVRDAWNILILIAGFVWGSKHQKSLQSSEGVTKTDVNISATTITEPKKEENDKAD